MERPDSPRLADVAAEWAAAYVHIPFCAVRCPYCDFAVVEGTEDEDDYFAALHSEIADASEFRPLQALNFGGGTPSLAGGRLPPIVELVRSRFGLDDDAEVSLEANPEDWDSTLAAELVDAGFNRVSFGVQSFDSLVLGNLGRRHTPEQAAMCVAIARDAGFQSVSLDLIIGDTGESDTSWQRTVQQAIDAGPDHVSTYALTVEPGTVLAQRVRDGESPPDDDTQAERYEHAVRELAGAGLIRYEVSNHARPGHACRYNLTVWGRGEYLGFGMSAHGFRDGTRYRNARVLGEYLRRVSSRESPVVGDERLSPEEAAQERLFVGLRRAAGVTIDEAAKEFLATPEAMRLVEAGVIDIDGDRLRVANPLLTDTVAREVLGA